MPGHSGLGSKGYRRAKHDNYPTPSAATEALMETVQWFGGSAWEPACGDGAMTRVLKSYFGRANVISTDLRVGTGCGRGGVDFLKTKKLLAPNIITNPPFKLWDAFAHHALDLGADRVALLGRFLLLEGFDRAERLMEPHLQRVIVLGRVKMRPPRTKDKGMSPMVCFAWFVFGQKRASALSIDWVKAT